MNAISAIVAIYLIFKAPFGFFFWTTHCHLRGDMTEILEFRRAVSEPVEDPGVFCFLLNLYHLQTGCQ
jgi:hypothetical protein